MKRRSNLQGISLNAVFDEYGAFSLLKKPVSSLPLRRIGNNEVYDVKDSVQGMAIDATHLLQKQLNYTINNMFMRKDRLFGAFNNGNLHS